MLEVVYENCGGHLPHYVTILQDNCQRECKNGKMLAAITKLKVLGVVDRIALAFPVKGHTHGPLDACGGQAVVKCSHSEFDSADELSQIYEPWFLVRQSVIFWSLSFSWFLFYSMPFAINIEDSFLKASQVDEGTARSLLGYKCFLFCKLSVIFLEVGFLLHSYKMSIF